MFASGGWEQGPIGLGNKETFQIWNDDAAILYLDRSSGYTDTWIYQNSLHGILKMCAFHCI